MPIGTRIFNSRFVDEVKNSGTDRAYEKSRIVVQAYNDSEKHIVLTQSPTIQRVSQRLILSIAAITIATNSDTHLFLRDITQAYVQSTSKLNREFYIRPPPELSSELGISGNTVLKVVKPLYGVPEAGNHWFTTYHSHHINQLGMSVSTFDPCLLSSIGPTKFGVVGLQTDDTLILCDTAFAELEELKLQQASLLAKEREELTTDHPIKFNGGLIQLLRNGNINLTQESQCNNLSIVNNREATTRSSRGKIRSSLLPRDQYVAQRARGAYIASMCQPEASFDLSFAA